MEDFSNIDTKKVRKMLAELKNSSDLHVPIFSASSITGVAGILLISQTEDETLQDLGFALAGFATGLSLSEVAAMAHRMMIKEKEGNRSFMFHHDAAGIIAILLGLYALADSDIPNKMGTLLIGAGLGALTHHLVTELKLEFVTPTEEDIEDQAATVEELVL